MKVERFVEWLAVVLLCTTGLAQAATPYAWYRMDETAWTGTAGQVLDSSGNGYNATAIGGATTAPGKVCRAGQFLNPQDTNGSVRTAVVTPFTVNSAWGAGRGSVDFWYRPRVALPQGQDTVLLDGTYTDAQGNYYPLMVLAQPPYLIFWFTDSSRDEYLAYAQYPFPVGWTHVGVTFNLRARRRRGNDLGRVDLYINGSAQQTSIYDLGTGRNVAQPFANSGSLADEPSDFYIGDLDPHLYSNNFRSALGLIDEWRLYTRAVRQKQIRRDENATHPCGVGNLGSLRVAAPGSASTCANLPGSITLTALDAAGRVLNRYAGTVSLSDSAGHGTWSAPAGAYGALTPGPADSGTATYTFSPRDRGSVTLDLVDAHADDLTVSATAGIVSGTSSVVQFRDNVFVIEPVNPLSPAYPKVVTAGRAENFGATLYDKDASTGLCNIATEYQGGMALKAWYTPSAIAPPGALAPNLGGIGLPATQPIANNLTVNFHAGRASFLLGTTDVGQYTLDLLDDTSAFAKNLSGAARSILGFSAALTVAPASLALTGIQTAKTSNTGATTPTGAVFAAAGAPFRAAISGELWGNAEVAPHFAWQTTLAAQAPFQPAKGVLGALAQGSDRPVSVPASSYHGGSAAIANLAYSEVGSFTLGVSMTGYLGTPGADASGTAIVGRFTPAWFTSAVTPGCANTFTYSRQPFTTTVTAYNTFGAITQNYNGTLGWSKEITLSDAADPKTPPGVFAVPGRYIAPADFAKGTATDPSVVYTFLKPDTAPYTLAIRADDQDLVSSAGHAQGITQIQSGRLFLQQAFGSERLALDMPVEIQHYTSLSGSSAQGFWALNKGDACTNLVPADFGLSHWTGALPAGATSITLAGVTSGSGFLVFSAPGTGKVGSVTVQGAGLPVWLDYPWGGAASPIPPSALASFGIYRGNRDLIYQQQVLR
jgi:MSHA biogenesis protein MshQ